MEHQVAGFAHGRTGRILKDRQALCDWFFVALFLFPVLCEGLEHEHQRQADQEEIAECQSRIVAPAPIGITAWISASCDLSRRSFRLPLPRSAIDSAAAAAGR